MLKTRFIKLLFSSSLLFFTVCLSVIIIRVIVVDVHDNFFGATRELTREIYEGSRDLSEYLGIDE